MRVDCVSVGLGLLLVSATLLACAADTASSSSTNVDAGAPTSDDPACEEGSTRCEGHRVATCVEGSFGPSEACEGESVCRDGACRAPTEKQIAQADELASMLQFIRDETGWHAPVDWEALRLDGRKNIFGGDGSDLAYVTALYRAFVAVPQGHQTFYLAEGCGKLVPFAHFSERGVCGQPHSRGIVVTSARAGNPLGLAKGDLVVRLGSASGTAVIDALAARPMCTASRPSASYREAVTATTFSDLLVPGEEIVIESADGAVRAVTVPDVPLSGNPSSALWCADPFARNTRVPVESELRPDGVGVIRLPGFTDPEQTFPTNLTEQEIDEYRAKFEAKILAAFDKVKSAPAIVWDIRGNGGGMTLVGLEIASGFPGARADSFSYCEARKPKSDPPAFDTFRYAELSLTPGGPFAYAGKVAIVVDGLDYSAADYFPLAAKTRTDAVLVGKPSAGAFGSTSKTRAFSGPPGFDVGVDVNRCSSVDESRSRAEASPRTSSSTTIRATSSPARTRCSSVRSSS